jgi:hypothetical protein
MSNATRGKAAGWLVIAGFDVAGVVAGIVAVVGGCAADWLGCWAAAGPTRQQIRASLAL